MACSDKSPITVTLKKQGGRFNSRQGAEAALRNYIADAIAEEVEEYCATDECDKGQCSPSYRLDVEDSLVKGALTVAVRKRRNRIYSFVIDASISVSCRCL